MCYADTDNSEKGKVTSAPIQLLSGQAGSVVLLQTLIIQASGSCSTERCRVLLDGGSQRSFITTELSRKLGCEFIEEEVLTVGVFGGKETSETLRRVRVRLHDPTGKTTLSVEALEVKSICNQMIPVPDERIINALQSHSIDTTAVLCGSESDKGIAILIGSDFYWDIVTGNIKTVGPCMKAVETRLGWTVQGPVPTPTKIVHCKNVVVLHASPSDVTSALKQFWELETIGIKDPTNTSTQDQVLEDFEKNIRLVDGRYEVALPWKPEVDLPDNFEVAERRLSHLMRKLSLSPASVEAYDKAIRQYIVDGTGEKAPTTTPNDGRYVYYLPHRAVIREDRLTTKIRIVFDASSHARGVRSLNDNLEVGPNLNSDIVALLLRFRQFKIGMTADVEKAFLQITLKEQDRDSLRFLWFESCPQLGQPLPHREVWRMSRVPFGATSSPFLLMATLRHHFGLHQSRYPRTTGLLMRSMYMDDLVFGAHSEVEAKLLYQETLEIFKAASMNIRKWITNNPTVAAVFQDGSSQEQTAYPLPSPKESKVLGLRWDTVKDCFGFNLQATLKPHDSPTTKRLTLRAIAQIFDPLGFLSPFVVTAKILLQDLWKRNLGWDDELPQDLLRVWEQWCEDLCAFSGLAIPRFLGHGMCGCITKANLHIFSDASPRAYGVAAYLCLEFDDDLKCTRLLLAKNRVAPIKEVTLAKLELTAASLAARMSRYIKENMDLNIAETHLWMDSLITLCWVRKEAATWKTFVRNRVQEIRRLSTANQWHYCPGTENPADLLTRGIGARSLIQSRSWWEGPAWISSSHHWPLQPASFDAQPEAATEEAKPQTLTLQISSSNPIDIARFSSLLRLHRVVSTTSIHSQPEE